MWGVNNVNVSSSLSIDICMSVVKYQTSNSCLQYGRLKMGTVPIY